MSKLQRNILFTLLAAALLLIIWRLAWPSRGGPSSSSPGNASDPASTSTAGGLSADDQKAVVGELMGLLAQRNDFGPTQCADYIEVNDPSVLDYTINGAVAQVAVRVQAKVKYDIVNLPTGLQVSNCFGHPSPELLPGETWTVVLHGFIQKWASGWRIISTNRDLGITDLNLIDPGSAPSVADNDQANTDETTGNATAASITSELTRRCDPDGSVVKITYFDDPKQIYIQSPSSATPVVLRASNAGGPYVANGGWRLTGNQRRFSLEQPGKSMQVCNP